MPVAAGWSSKAAPPVPPAVPKDKDVLDIAVPVANVELSESARSAFATVIYAMKDGCSL